MSMLASMALSSTGLSPTCHLAPSVSDVITLFCPCVPPPVVFPKAPFLVPCFLSCTLPLSALSSRPFHSITTFMQITPNCFSHFTHPTSTQASPITKMPFSWMTANLLTLNPSKTEFLLIGLKKQLDKIHNSSLNTTHSARNLGFIFDEQLTFSGQI